MTSRWGKGGTRPPRASPHRARPIALPPTYMHGGGGHGQQPRQQGGAEPGGPVSPHDESGAAAASEGPGAGLAASEGPRASLCAPPYCGTSRGTGYSPRLLPRLLPTGESVLDRATGTEQRTRTARPVLRIKGSCPSRARSGGPSGTVTEAPERPGIRRSARWRTRASSSPRSQRKLAILCEVTTP